jgi:hypothetical protein
MMFWLFEPETQAVPDTMGKQERTNELNLYTVSSWHELVLVLDVFFKIDNNHLV